MTRYEVVHSEAFFMACRIGTPDQSERAYRDYRDYIDSLKRIKVHIDQELEERVEDEHDRYNLMLGE